MLRKFRQLTLLETINSILGGQNSASRKRRARRPALEISQAQVAPPGAKAAPATLVLTALSVVSIVLTAMSFGCGRGGNAALRVSAGTANHHSASPTPMGREDAIPALISKLSSGSEDERAAAKKELLLLSKSSESERDRVVKELISRIDRPDVAAELGRPSFSRLWVGAAEILSELKATEAISIFIKCIHCTAVTEHVSSTYHHLPAFRALIGMGEVAVPPLSEALHDENRRVRKYAALGLGNIGGTVARQNLVSALNSESDPEVRTSMEDAVATIDRES